MCIHCGTTDPFLNVAFCDTFGIYIMRLLEGRVEISFRNIRRHGVILVQTNLLFFVSPQQTHPSA